MDPVTFTSEMMLRSYFVVGISCFLILLVLAYFNKITVYRDYADVGFSLVLIIVPFTIFFALLFIAGDDSEIFSLIRDTWIGRALFFAGLLISIFCMFKTFTYAIADNGLLAGLIVALAKIIISLIVTIISISLIRYLFRDERKIGHIAIFFILLGVFTWVFNILINGEKVGAADSVAEN